MACQIKRKDNGTIDTVLAPNGKPSVLYNSLVNTIASSEVTRNVIQSDPYVSSVMDSVYVMDNTAEELALAAWSKAYTIDFIDSFGNWKEDKLPNTDSNGEPIVSVLFPEITDTGVKPGISELFESNPELANQVYSTLGFKGSEIIEIAEKRKEEVEKAFNDPESTFVYYGDEDMADDDFNRINPIDTVELPKEYRNKGLGTLKYVLEGEKNLKKGMFMTSDPTERVSVQADSIWKKLIRFGLAEIRNERYYYTGLKITPQQKQQAQEQYSAYLDQVFPDSVFKNIMYHGGNTFEELKPNELELIYFAEDLEYADVYKKRAQESATTTKALASSVLKEYTRLKNAIAGLSNQDLTTYDTIQIEKAIDYLASYTTNTVDQSVALIIDKFKNNRLDDLSINPEFGMMNEDGDEGSYDAEQEQFNDYYDSLSEQEKKEIDRKNAAAKKQQEDLITSRFFDIVKGLEKYQKEQDNSDYIQEALKVQSQYENIQAEGKLYSAVLNVKNPQYTDENISNESIKEGKIILDKSKDSLIGKDALFYKRVEGKKITVEGKNVVAVKNSAQVYTLGTSQDIRKFKEFVQNKKQVTVKQGVSELFIENPQLATIGTQEQYSTYLDQVFPDSKVKDIVYHGSYSKNIDKFSKDFLSRTSLTGFLPKGFYFTNQQYVAATYTAPKDVYNKAVWSSLVNFIEGVKDETGEYLQEPESFEKLLSYIEKSNDKKEFIIDYRDGKLEDSFGGAAEAGLFLPSKEDTELYLKFIKNKDLEGIKKKRDEYSSEEGNIYPAILNIKIPLYKKSETGSITTINLEGRTAGEKKITLNKELKNSDGLVVGDIRDASDYKSSKNIKYDETIDEQTYVVFEPEQIHILGSKQDIEGFKRFVSKPTTPISDEWTNVKNNCPKLI